VGKQRAEIRNGIEVRKKDVNARMNEKSKYFTGLP
jgi:hypothetical protein